MPDPLASQEVQHKGELTRGGAWDLTLAGCDPEVGGRSALARRESGVTQQELNDLIPICWDDPRRTPAADKLEELARES